MSDRPFGAASLPPLGLARSMTDPKVIAACRKALEGADFCFGTEVINDVLATMPYTGDLDTDITVAFATARLSFTRHCEWSTGSRDGVPLKRQ